MAQTLTVDRFWEYRLMVEKDIKDLRNEESVNDIYLEIVKAIQISVKSKKEKLVKVSKLYIKTVLSF
ncbi:MAG: hypothetical protein WCR36_07385 [Bacteroidaceae bacterium]